MHAKSSVVRIADALMATPCKSDVLRSVGDIEAVAKVFVALGDERRARAALARFDAIEAAQKKKSDLDYVKSSRTELMTELGLDTKDKKTKSRATPRAAKRDDDDETEVRSIAVIMRGVKSAFDELTPDEWNVHNPAGDLSRAVRDLHARGEKKKAVAVLTRALDMFATGAHDGRGFASGGAYVELASAAFVVEGVARAKPLLEKSLVVAGKHRQMIVSDAARAYGEMGLIDEGLAVAQKVRPEARRIDTVAEILFRAGRWKALAQELARIRDPEAGAKTAWTLSRVALGRE